MGELRNACKDSVKNHEGMRPLGIHRCRVGDNIKICLKEMRCYVVKWIQLAQYKGCYHLLMKDSSVLYIFLFVNFILLRKGDVEKAG
jgi:hypothetical protein